MEKGGRTEKKTWEKKPEGSSRVRVPIKGEKKGNEEGREKKNERPHSAHSKKLSKHNRSCELKGV